jgi:hypothetical protein
MTCRYAPIHLTQSGVPHILSITVRGSTNFSRQLFRYFIELYHRKGGAAVAMYYLLGTQVIIDIARGAENGAARWLKRADGKAQVQDIKVSTMSWAAIEIEFRNLSLQHGSLTRSQTFLRQRIDRVFDQYRRLRSILPITDKAVQLWVDYLQDDLKYSDADGNPRSVGLEEKMVLATAMAGFQDIELILVAKREAVHSKFSFLGLKIEDPYNGNAP